MKTLPHPTKAQAKAILARLHMLARAGAAAGVERGAFEGVKAHERKVERARDAVTDDVRRLAEYMELTEGTIRDLVSAAKLEDAATEPAKGGDAPTLASAWREWEARSAEVFAYLAGDYDQWKPIPRELGARYIEATEALLSTDAVRGNNNLTRSIRRCLTAVKVASETTAFGLAANLINPASLRGDVAFTEEPVPKHKPAPAKTAKPAKPVESSLDSAFRAWLTATAALIAWLPADRDAKLPDVVTAPYREASEALIRAAENGGVSDAEELREALTKSVNAVTNLPAKSSKDRIPDRATIHQMLHARSKASTAKPEPVEPAPAKPAPAKPAPAKPAKEGECLPCKAAQQQLDLDEMAGADFLDAAGDGGADAEDVGADFLDAAGYDGDGDFDAEDD